MATEKVKEKTKELLDCNTCCWFIENQCRANCCRAKDIAIGMHEWTLKQFVKWYKANHNYTADTIKKLKKAMEEQL